MYSCVIACKHKAPTEFQYLWHLKGCDKIAPWVKVWAAKVVGEPDWRTRIGLIR